MLYSLKNNYPTVLPDRIRLSSGLTRTDSSTFTAEEIADAGYVEVSEPPPYRSDQTLTWGLTADGEFDWIVTDRTIHEQWDLVREQRDAKMAAFEWRIRRSERLQFLQLPPVEDVTDLHRYMQLLADVTKQTDPYHIEWPAEPLLPIPNAVRTPNPPPDGPLANT